MEDVRAAVDRLDAALRVAGTADRAADEKRYLKSDLEFYGVTMPVLTKLTREWSAELEPVDRSLLVDLVEALWSVPVHERRAAAMKLLARYERLLEPGDIDVVERLLRQSRTWALVDEIAVHVAGPVLARHPDADAVLDRWSSDDDFWIRRSALLSHLAFLRSGTGDWDRFARYADSMLDEKEFFIRKAVGWILRDTSRKRPDLVYEWILPRAHRASGVTVREAIKKLAPEQQKAVLERYRGVTGEA